MVPTQIRITSTSILSPLAMARRPRALVLERHQPRIEALITSLLDPECRISVHLEVLTAKSRLRGHHRQVWVWELELDTRHMTNNIANSHTARHQSECSHQCNPHQWEPDTPHMITTTTTTTATNNHNHNHNTITDTHIPKAHHHNHSQYPNNNHHHHQHQANTVPSHLRSKHQPLFNQQ